MVKKRFVSNEGIQLEVNAHAPVPKKRRTKVSHTVEHLEDVPRIDHNMLGSHYPATLCFSSDFITMLLSLVLICKENVLKTVGLTEANVATVLAG